MKKENKSFGAAGVSFLLFLLLTAAVQYVDVKQIGPRGSAVGFATVNGWCHELTGVHMLIYTVTDWLSLVALVVITGFAIIGLTQLIKRRSLLKVDKDILLLGGFYIIVMLAYILFEVVVINYRPVLIDGYLEASYPSSTTLLIMCVLPTAIVQLDKRIQNNRIRKAVKSVMVVFTVFMVVGRAISGVHWLTDILGSILLSVALVSLYRATSKV